MENRFFIYGFLRKDGTFYYIGKGTKRRIFSYRKSGIKRPKNDERIIILHRFLDEKTAFEYEKNLIKFYGRIDKNEGILRNLTDGGEGVSGWIPSTEWRINKSKSMIGENNHFYGKKHSEEFKKRLSKEKTGKKLGKNQKISDRLKGENNPMYGKKRPDLVKFSKENPPALGTKWFNNGIKSIRCKEGEEPEGFIKGRIKRK